MDSDLSQRARADREIEARILQLRLLSFASVAELPIEAEDEVYLDGARGKLRVIAMRGPHTEPGSLLVVVHIAYGDSPHRKAAHVERGLIFSRDKALREATELELRTSGGGNRD
jgi:hypothetical protein